MILAQISKYQDCYSVLNMVLEIVCHFGISKRERQIKTNAKSQIKAKSSSRALESTTFIHVEKKGTARKDRTKRARERTTTTLTLDIPL